MEWVHCNSCFHQPGDRRFVLTNCGHIFCEVCHNKWAANKCSICNDACSITELTRSKDMKPEIKIYFSDPLNLMSKMSKEVVEVPLGKVVEYQEYKCKQISKIMKFQWEHMMRFFNYYKTTAKKAINEVQQYKVNLEVANSEVAYSRKLRASPSPIRKELGSSKGLYAPVNQSGCHVHARSGEEGRGSPPVKRKPYEHQQPPVNHLSSLTNSLQSFKIVTPSRSHDINNNINNNNNNLNNNINMNNNNNINNNNNDNIKNNNNINNNINNNNINNNNNNINLLSSNYDIRARNNNVTGDISNNHNNSNNHSNNHNNSNNPNNSNNSNNHNNNHNSINNNNTINCNNQLTSVSALRQPSQSSRCTPQRLLPQLPPQTQPPHASQRPAPSQQPPLYSSQQPPLYSSQQPPQFSLQQTARKTPQQTTHLQPSLTGQSQFTTPGPSRLTMRPLPVYARLGSISGSQRTLNSGDSNSSHMTAPTTNYSKLLTPLSVTGMMKSNKTGNKLYERLAQLGCPITRAP